MNQTKAKKPKKSGVKKPIKDLMKDGPVEVAGGDFKQYLFRVEALIFLAIVVVILVILFLVMPVLRQAGRNNMRQHDVGIISDRIGAAYQRENKPAPFAELIDERGHFQDTTAASLHIYRQAVFYGFENPLRTDRSYYSSQRFDFKEESFLPDIGNVHIWFGYGCETQVDIVLSLQQIKYKALRGFIKEQAEPGYIILYKLEQRRSTYRCLEVPLK